MARPKRRESEAWGGGCQPVKARRKGPPAAPFSLRVQGRNVCGQPRLPAGSATRQFFLFILQVCRKAMLRFPCLPVAAAAFSGRNARRSAAHTVGCLPALARIPRVLPAHSGALPGGEKLLFFRVSAGFRGQRNWMQLAIILCIFAKKHEDNKQKADPLTLRRGGRRHRHGAERKGMGAWRLRWDKKKISFF